MIKQILAWIESNSSSEVKAKEIKVIANRFSLLFCKWVNDNFYYLVAEDLYIPFSLDTQKRYRLDELLLIYNKNIIKDTLM